MSFIGPQLLKLLLSTSSNKYDPMRMFKERHRKRDQSHIGFQKDGKQTNRESVIKTTNMQEAYSIPIANSFDTLGNLDKNSGNL